MKAVSLFAGIGGFDLAMQRVGIETVAAIEIDAKCRDVLAAHFPNTKLFEDVTKVGADELRATGFNARDGIITGGFPCQDLSVAGARKGLAGTRSRLFWEIVRLADELKPKYLVLENVFGLLSSNNGRDMGVIIGALAELGYGICWRVLDAQHFGVPQRRRRVFFVCCLGDHRRPVEILFESEGGGRYLDTRSKKKQDLAQNIDAITESISEPNRRVAPTLKARDFKGLNSEDIQQGKYVLGLQNTIINRSASAGPSGDGFSPLDGPMFTLDTMTPPHAVNVVSFSHYQRQPTYAHELAPTLNSNGHAVVMRQREGKAGGGKGPLLSDKSLTLATSNDQTLFTSSVVRRLTPKECERLQGFPDDWTAGQVDGHRYKQMGNAVAVPVVEWIVRRLVACEQQDAEGAR